MKRRGFSMCEVMHWAGKSKCEREDGMPAASVSTHEVIARTDRALLREILPTVVLIVALLGDLFRHPVGCEDGAGVGCL